MSVNRIRPPTNPTAQDVHDVAYHLWLETGGQPGCERESWTRARELLSTESMLRTLFARGAATASC